MDARLRHARRLLQLGVALILFALLVGLAVPLFAVPRLGLSVHLLGLMQGLYLIGLGLLWPNLTLTPAIAIAGRSLAMYGCVAALAANFLAAVWGAGNSIVPIAAGSARGTQLQEGIITVGLRSAGVSLIVATAIVLWGLRRNQEPTNQVNP